MTDVPDPPTGPAESRAIELLQLVGSDTPAVSERFTPDLVLRARRQRAVAVPLRVLGGFVAALAVAFVGAVSTTRGEPRS
jgi:hypothetical protein